MSILGWTVLENVAILAAIVLVCLITGSAWGLVLAIFMNSYRYKIRSKS